MAGSLKDRDFSPELTFSASRSSGPGGQNTNKVNTRVELRFSIVNSNLLTGEEKERLLARLKNKVNTGGEWVITSQNSRSQFLNKKETVEKFYALLEKALAPRKKRKPTQPSQASIEKRLIEKHIQSEKKNRRGKMGDKP
ncbi:MAG TPA: alternative ribosome rescue aminoacyl-tRNA hydrolase ArfB, partial [Prolixibacteraceae bacterium]|nr:alternative ribosome rescue aminoacyl-tRNA hydrolase ArfB [Prolixibacteraceae bacterium]